MDTIHRLVLSVWSLSVKSQSANRNQAVNSQRQRFGLSAREKWVILHFNRLLSARYWYLQSRIPLHKKLSWVSVHAALRMRQFCYVSRLNDKQTHVRMLLDGRRLTSLRELYGSGKADFTELLVLAPLVFVFTGDTKWCRQFAWLSITWAMKSTFKLLKNGQNLNNFSTDKK